MRCGDCAHWINRRTTLYADGSHVDTFSLPDGKGQCQQLNIETVETFGCIEYAEGHEHAVFSHKDGAPWEHWVYVPCPDCSGDAAKNIDGRLNMCMRCAGIGKVRRYDDGFVGNERDQMHPEEAKRRAPPKCGNCSKLIQLDWAMCPFCGTKLLELPAPTEVIELDLRVEPHAKRRVLGVV